MVVSYGEILVDMIGTEKDGVFAYERHAGGAPFNVACACKRAGGTCGFVGAVGDDSIGKYLCGFAKEQELDAVDITVVPDANTTLAFVELAPDGERSFCFYRKNTADYRLTEQSLAHVDGANIVHLGSLMLNEQAGIDFADKLLARVKAAGKKLSFDINYRDDIFPDSATAMQIFAKYAEAADIVKYSEDELEMFTGRRGLDAVRELARPGKLVCVTLGKQGSAYAYGSIIGVAPSIPVKPIDTTGAGDAFYGALLARLDRADISAWNADAFDAAFRFANVAGALATTARGALSSLPTLQEIETESKRKFA